jgi:predicted nucleic acid-binding protein
VIVIDASALLEVLLRSERSDAVARRILASKGALHAPHLIDLEVAQVVRRFARRNEVNEARVREVFADLADFRLVRHPHQFLLPLIWGLRDHLTAYDAAYLALAHALQTTLVTCDKALANVPGYGDNVELIA